MSIVLPLTASITEREETEEAAADLVTASRVADEVRPIRYAERSAAASGAYATAGSGVIAWPSAHAAPVTEAMLYPNTNTPEHDFI